MGDVFRRLVARTLARQFGAAFRTACAPFQYALSTRAGSEAVVRAVQTAIEADPRMTVLSIDGVGAYDHISRASMLEALRAHAPLTGQPLHLLRRGRCGARSAARRGRGARRPPQAGALCARPTRRPPRPALPASPAGRIVCVSGRCLHHIPSGAHTSGLASRADVVVPSRQRPGTPWENSRLERSWRRARGASGSAAVGGGRASLLDGKLDPAGARTGSGRAGQPDWKPGVRCGCLGSEAGQARGVARPLARARGLAKRMAAVVAARGASLQLPVANRSAELDGRVRSSP